MVRTPNPPLSPTEHALLMSARWRVAGDARPAGGAGHHGVFALSTARLRFRPRASSRLRGAVAAEWALEDLGSVSVEPAEGRRWTRRSRWVVLDVTGQDAVTLLNGEQHLTAADLSSAIAEARSRSGAPGARAQTGSTS